MADLGWRVVFGACPKGPGFPLQGLPKGGLFTAIPHAGECTYKGLSI